MKLNVQTLSTVTLLFCAVAYTDLSHAADDAPFGVSKSQDAPIIQMGPVEVHPFISLKETYSDNIYLVTADKTHDFITTIAPGVQFKMPIRRHALFLTGSTTLNRYAGYSSENSTDWSLSGAGDFNFGSRINLKVVDSFLAGHEPRSQSALADMETFRNNNAAASLTYILADISKLQLDYANDYWKFKNSDFRTRDENLVSVYAYYRVMPKTSLFTEYDFKNVYYTSKPVGSNDFDNKVHSALLGLTWELSTQSKGTVKGGYLYKVFDAPSLKNLGTFAASADISHHFSDYNSIKLIGARAVNESSLEGTRYSISTGMSGEFSHKFVERCSASVKASFSDESFADTTGETVKRSDQIVVAGAKAVYTFRRWLESALEYYWRQKNSNIDIYDSTENNVSFTLKASF
jgi:hypothetical protein